MHNAQNITMEETQKVSKKKHKTQNKQDKNPFRTTQKRRNILKVPLMNQLKCVSTDFYLIMSENHYLIILCVSLKKSQHVDSFSVYRLVV